MKIVYIIGGAYAANGMSDVMTRKVNWLARNTEAELYVVLTERPDLPLFYPLDELVNVINFNLNFDRLDTLPLWRKLLLYGNLQRQYRERLSHYLMNVQADVVVSALRRDINFLCDIPDGSRKVGELHFARSSYRSFHKAFLPECINKWITKCWQRKLIAQLNRLQHFVVLSHEDAAAWPELKNLVVIPNSIHSFPQTTASMDTFRVVAAGRYTHQKGFDLLLQAWAEIEEKHPQWHLDIYGSGDATPYRNLIQTLGLHHVICHDQTPNLQSEMLASSVFAFSSRYEGFGLVLAEAMACGLAVVSFACPCGPRDIINDGNDGLLVPPEDIKAFASALDKLMGDEALRVRLSQAARVSSQRFSEENIMQQWKKLFLPLEKLS